MTYLRRALGSVDFPAKQVEKEKAEGLDQVPAELRLDL